MILKSCSAVTKILDLPENQEVVVIGTLYKEMKLKPSILNEYNKVFTGPFCNILYARLSTLKPATLCECPMSMGCTEGRWEL